MIHLQECVRYIADWPTGSPTIPAPALSSSTSIEESATFQESNRKKSRSSESKTGELNF